MRSPRLRARCRLRFTGGAARGLRCRTRHPSHGSHPVWLLDFCRCSNQKCCAAPPGIMRQCCEAAMARVNTSLTVACTPRRPKRRCATTRFDAALLPARGRRSPSGSLLFRPAVTPANARSIRRGGGLKPPSRRITSPTPRALAGSPTRAIPEAFGSGRCRPGCPAGPARLPRCKTQYKCGKSRVRNNHPLGKPGYDQRLLLAPGSLLRWSEKAAATGLSNGVQMLVHSATDGSTKTPAIRAMEWSLLEAFRTVGLKA